MPFDQFAPKVWLPLGLLTCLVVFFLHPVRGEDHISDTLAGVLLGAVIIGLPVLNGLVRSASRR